MSRSTSNFRTSRKARLLALAAIVLLIFGLGQLASKPAYGAQLGQRALQLSDDTISANTTYALSFNLPSSGTLGSIVAQFCSNDPNPGTACTPPVGMDLSGAVLQSQTGPSGFSISPLSTINRVVLTRPASVAAAAHASYHFTNMINPSSPGSYYVRVQTYASTNASGVASNYGGIAFEITGQLSITATVPPYLIFCVAVTIANLNCADANGDFIDFGELSYRVASSGSSQMLVATNAQSGYGITADGPTLTSGNNIIDAISIPDVSRPGTAQFGFNLRANNTPQAGTNPTGPGVAQPVTEYNQPNIYQFNSGDVVVSNPVPDDVREYTTTYIVNVPITQAAGVYVSTITYICLASF